MRMRHECVHRLALAVALTLAFRWTPPLLHPPGTPCSFLPCLLSLFKAFCDADNATATEHSWDPMRRWSALSRTLRTPRGSKSHEHLQNLRKSDPLISLSAWHDWQQLFENSRYSPQARAHQLAVYERGLMRATRAAAEATAAAAAIAERMNETVSPFLNPNAAHATNELKRAMHLGRLRTVDGYQPSAAGEAEEAATTPATSKVDHKVRPERFSNDSVMCWDVGYMGSPTLRPAVRHSPTLHGGAPPLPPIADLDGGIPPPYSAKGKLPADPSSPGSVMGLPLEPLDEATDFRRYKLGEAIAES